MPSLIIVRGSDVGRRRRYLCSSLVEAQHMIGVLTSEDLHPPPSDFISNPLSDQAIAIIDLNEDLSDHRAESEKARERFWETALMASLSSGKAAGEAAQIADDAVLERDRRREERRQKPGKKP